MFLLPAVICPAPKNDKHKRNYQRNGWKDERFVFCSPLSYLITHLVMIGRGELRRRKILLLQRCGIFFFAGTIEQKCHGCLCKALPPLQFGVVACCVLSASPLPSGQILSPPAIAIFPGNLVIFIRRNIIVRTFLRGKKGGGILFWSGRNICAPTYIFIST